MAGHGSLAPTTPTAGTTALLPAFSPHDDLPPHNQSNSACLAQRTATHTNARARVASQARHTLIPPTRTVTYLFFRSYSSLSPVCSAHGAPAGVDDGQGTLVRRHRTLRHFFHPPHTGSVPRPSRRAVQALQLLSRLFVARDSSSDPFHPPAPIPSPSVFRSSRPRPALAHRPVPIVYVSFFTFNFRKIPHANCTLRASLPVSP